jgi:hypothetical protein
MKVKKDPKCPSCGDTNIENFYLDKMDIEVLNIVKSVTNKIVKLDGILKHQ